jgi:hypothetical protein
MGEQIVVELMDSVQGSCHSSKMQMGGVLYHSSQLLLTRCPDHTNLSKWVVFALTASFTCTFRQR